MKMDLPKQTGVPVKCSECDTEGTTRITIGKDGEQVRVECVKCGAGHGERYGVWKGQKTEIVADGWERRREDRRG